MLRTGNWGRKIVRLGSPSLWKEGGGGDKEHYIMCVLSWELSCVFKKKKKFSKHQIGNGLLNQCQLVRTCLLACEMPTGQCMPAVVCKVQVKTPQHTQNLTAADGGGWRMLLSSPYGVDPKHPQKGMENQCTTPFVWSQKALECIHWTSCWSSTHP